MKTQEQVQAVLCLVLFILAVSGCKSELEKSMPRLYPCAIEIVNKGTPVADVNVVLMGDESVQQLSMGGVTDAEGVARINTMRGSFIGKGVPQGEYKITLNKKIEITGTKTSIELADMSTAERKKYQEDMKASVNRMEEEKRLIPVIVQSGQTTPLEVSVTPGGGELLNIDLSEIK
ncbi:MAG: hypothetical protein Q4G68_04230 [Planctomycetia bacterium]|nr:hypothetical protein [Planctomycetia bacterium]